MACPLGNCLKKENLGDFVAQIDQKLTLVPLCFAGGLVAPSALGTATFSLSVAESVTIWTFLRQSPCGRLMPQKGARQASTPRLAHPTMQTVHLRFFHSVFSYFSMTDFQNKKSGLLLGSFVADALSLGVHWIYDVNELSNKFGYVSDYYAPGFDSYHPKKQAGEQSHVGDQALRLAKFLSRYRAWSAESFIMDWLTMWADYGDYFDHATKATLQNIEDGKAPTAAASESDELAGAARIAPLVAFYADKPEADAVKACLEQTLLTHASEASEEATVFLAMAAYRIVNGAPLEATLRETAPEWALKKADDVLALDAVAAIAQLGQSCPLPAALPAVIYLALKHGDDLPKAFSENAMAGGDNCARALALGMLLGAAHGADAIPEPWQNGLLAKDLIDLYGLHE